MDHFVERTAIVLALGAALLAGSMGAWQNLPVLILGLRALVAAVVVFLFVRIGGQLAGRALLHSIAESQLPRERAQAPPHERKPDESGRLAA